MARRETTYTPKEGGSLMVTAAVGCAMISIVLLFVGGCLVFGALSVIEVALPVGFGSG